MNIHATAIVSAQAELADDVEIGPYCIVGDRVKLARGVRLRSHVVVEGETEIGEACEIFPFAAIGGPPQHSAYQPEHSSRVVIGARNSIREHVTIHGGSVVGRGVTIIGDDGQFYVGAHVGHDCVVGNHVVMTNGAALGGHCHIEDHVILGGLSSVQQRGRVGRHAFVGGMSGVNCDVIPFGTVWGSHAKLEGLNLVGLKRRGFSRTAINRLRAAFKEIFYGSGAFRERVEAAAVTYADAAEVMEVIAFIRAEPTRPLTMPPSESTPHA
ncbi:MAG TPA: acyl-ACP--UDP-N-acetylglucosamine O-acyltransferase [Caulobacteraceae bacterium]|nr:acyl-ACP--UDP-N-acetylglucosamine O-acyltransferase [Caulobacteraceae bacterium]